MKLRLPGSITTRPGSTTFENDQVLPKVRSASGGCCAKQWRRIARTASPWIFNTADVVPPSGEQ